MIKARADLYSQIRAFFQDRNVLEVETPLLSIASATDPQLESVMATLKPGFGELGKPYYLNTSPEFPMKRLLASGSGAIYQIVKTFRNGETSKRHNPEFSMLEWYRPDFSLTMLMGELEQLLTLVLGPIVTKKLSYQDAFLKYLSFDPFEINEESLAEKAITLAGYEGERLSRDDYLNLLLGVCIEPLLGLDHEGSIVPVFLYDYPPSQASLAKIGVNLNGHKVAKRFELYIRGIELANAYDELTNAVEQESRFTEDNKAREKQGLDCIVHDKHLIDALAHGLPECSGIALGLDRLLMIQQRAQSIDDVLSFPIDRA